MTRYVETTPDGSVIAEKVGEVWKVEVTSGEEVGRWTFAEVSFEASKIIAWSCSIRAGLVQP